MNTKLDFIRAICENKADDTVRLVYADYLQENGEEERAEFIRVQVELARDPHTEDVRTRNYDARDGISDEWQRMFGLVAREWELLKRNAYDLLSNYFGAEQLYVESGRSVVVFSIQPPMSAQFKFSRGFVSHITCSVEDWLKHHEAIYWHPSQNRPYSETAQPIEKVILTTTPESTGNINDFALWKELEKGEPWRSHRWPGIEFELLTPENLEPFLEPMNSEGI